MSNKQMVIAACLKVEPNPEHGPGQYEVVFDLMIEEYPGFKSWSNRRATQTVLDWMQMGED